MWSYEYLTSLSEEIRMFMEVTISMADIAYLVARSVVWPYPFFSLELMLPYGL